jgi:hypothetical protein
MNKTFLVNFFGSLRCKGPGEIIVKIKFQKSWAGRRYVSLTYGFATYPKVGPRATVGTL